MTMKKIYCILSVALAIVATASCTKEFEPVQVKPIEKGLVEMTLCASKAGIDTKADLGANLAVTWAENDTIAVYDGAAARIFTVASLEKNGGVAYFKGYVADTAKTITAVYPASAFVSVVDTLVNVSIPSSQTVAYGQLADPKALVAYARTERIDSTKADLSFQNVTALVRITVGATDTLSTVLVKGNASEKIAGAVACKDAEEVCSGSTSVTLSRAEADSVLTASNYYLAVAPTTFTAGVTVVAGKCLSTSSNALTLLRNHTVSLGNVASGAQVVNLPSKIGSVEDFVLFSQYSNFYSVTDVIELTADLDLANAPDFTPEKYNRYYGSIEGNNHRIYNYTIAGKSGDASVFQRVGCNDPEHPTFIRNIAFGSKDYDFTTGQGTYDGVSTCTFDIKDDGSTYYYPGCVAYVYGYTTVENLVNFTPVTIPSTCTSRHRAGALLGTVKNNVTIKNCKNYGDITNNSSTLACNKAATTGGLVGAFDGVNCYMENCTNYGKVSIGGDNTQDAAGIIGYAQYAHAVVECTNNGEIVVTATNTKANRFGGIAPLTNYKLSSGYDTKTSSYDRCGNFGNITVEGTATCDVFVGGVTSRSYSTSLTACSNNGKITVNVTNTGKNVYIGGVTSNMLGSANTCLVTELIDCFNNGDITVTNNGARYYVGGVAGYNATLKDKLTNCGNTAKLVAANCVLANNGYLAGILGYDASGGTQVSKCVNEGTLSFVGDVNKNTYVGGILAQGENAAGLISGCTNKGTIKGGSPDQTTVATIMTVAGIAGTTTGSVKNCINEGTIEFKPNETTPCRLFGAGIIAANTVPTELSGCTNKGKIEVGQVSYSAYSYLGGVCGTMGPKKFLNNRNEGDIVSTANTTKDVSAQFYVGGLVGVAIAGTTPAASFSGNSVKCAITVDANTAAYAGMALGRNAYTTAWTLGSESDPVKVAGSLNGTAVTADNLMAFGSGNAADASGAVCTVIAALGE